MLSPAPGVPLNGQAPPMGVTARAEHNLCSGDAGTRLQPAATCPGEPLHGAVAEPPGRGLHPSLMAAGDGVSRALSPSLGSALLRRGRLLRRLASGFVWLILEPGLPQLLPQQRPLHVAHTAAGAGSPN